MTIGLAHLAVESGPRAQPRSRGNEVDGGALVVGSAVATVVLVVGLVGLLLLLVRKKGGSALGRRLDLAAGAIGFAGEDFGLRGRRWRGAWGLEEVVVSVTPGSSRAAEELVIHVPVASDLEPLRISATHRVLAPLGAHPLYLPSSLGHLVAFGDATTLQRLLGSATAQARLQELVGDREGFDTSLAIGPGELELRVVGVLTPRLDALLLRRLLEVCRAFAEPLR